MTNYRKQFQKVFTNDQMERINMCETQTCLSMEVDVHGMDCVSAKRFLSNLVALVRSDCILSVVHGYHNGTAIKDMIRNTIFNERTGPYLADPDNPGRTLFFVSPPAFLCAA